jgi:hypothetical protein
LAVRPFLKVPNFERQRSEFQDNARQNHLMPLVESREARLDQKKYADADNEKRNNRVAV